MAFANPNQKQTLELIEEMTSTRNLLAYGVRVVRTGAFVSTTRDPRPDPDDAVDRRREAIQAHPWPLTCGLSACPGTGAGRSVLFKTRRPLRA